MNWKRTILAVALAGITACAVTGCGHSEQAATTLQQTPVIAQSTITQPTIGNQQNPAPFDSTMSLPPGSERPAPPSGMTQGERPVLPPMDYAAAAAKLGVTEEALRDAMSTSNQQPLNMATAAQKLGITEQALREALGFPAGGPNPGGTPPNGVPPSGETPMNQEL